jgi:hypothetical protein
VTTRTTVRLQDEIRRRRLQAQLLSKTSLSQPEDVVARLGAVQAQDYLGALWAIGLRLRGARERDVELALAERRIVRTWPMRGTLHFVAAKDARWITELLAPRAAAAAANRLGALGIDGPLLARARRVLVENLEGGRQLTRPAVYRVLERARIPTHDQRGLHVLWRLAHDTLVCFGPREGKQQTFVLFDEWLPSATRLPRDQALAELARRYFTGHGPATLADFVWWSGLKVADGRAAMGLAGKEIEEETIGGARYWFGPSGSPAARKGPGPVAHVLPPFDELMVGYADRSAAIDPPGSAPSSAFALLGSVLTIDGRVVGTWKRRIDRRRVALSTAPYTPLDAAATGAIERALERYAAFLGLELAAR